MNTDQMVCESPEEHDNHICQLVTKVSMGEIVNLLDLPSFTCSNCARVANSEKNLCRPINLDDIKYEK